MGSAALGWSHGFQSRGRLPRRESPRVPSWRPRFGECGFGRKAVGSKSGDCGSESDSCFQSQRPRFWERSVVSRASGRLPCEQARGYRAGGWILGSAALGGEPRVPESATAVWETKPCEKARGYQAGGWSLGNAALGGELRVPEPDRGSFEIKPGEKSAVTEPAPARGNCPPPLPPFSREPSPPAWRTS